MPPKPDARLKDRVNQLLALLLLVSLVKGVMFVSIVPPWQAPDEPKHFEYVARLYNSIRFPNTYVAHMDQQPRIIASMRDFDFWKFGYSNSPPETSYSFASIWSESPTQLHRPPLYYAAEMFGYSFVSQRDTATQLYFLRLESVLMGVLAVLVAILTARVLFPGDPLLAVAVPAFVVSLPMPAFLFGSVNSDNLANLIAALFILVLTAVLRKGLSQGRIFVLLALLVLGLFTKRTLLFMFPLGLVTVLLCVSGRIPAIPATRRLVAAVAVPVAALAVSLPFWNWQGAGGVFLDRYIFDSPAIMILRDFFAREYTTGEIINAVAGHLGMLHQSFWAQFGWMNVAFDEPWYYLLAGITALAALGLVLRCFREFKGMHASQVWQGRVMVLYVISILLLLSVVLGQAILESLPGTQGRYLFPVIIPIATLFVVGLRELLPRNTRVIGLCAVIGGFFLFDIASQVYLIVPSFYG